MKEAVYILCSITSFICAALLFRAYLTQASRILLWSSVCFLGLFINNILLFIDVVLVPQQDLSIIRLAAALIPSVMLLYGLIWDSVWYATFFIWGVNIVFYNNRTFFHTLLVDNSWSTIFYFRGRLRITCFGENYFNSDIDRKWNQNVRLSHQTSRV